MINGVFEGTHVACVTSKTPLILWVWVVRGGRASR